MRVDRVREAGPLSEQLHDVYKHAALVCDGRVCAVLRLVEKKRISEIGDSSQVGSLQRVPDRDGAVVEKTASITEVVSTIGNRPKVGRPPVDREIEHGDSACG